MNPQVVELYSKYGFLTQKSRFMLTGHTEGWDKCCQGTNPDHYQSLSK